LALEEKLHQNWEQLRTIVEIRNIVDNKPLLNKCELFLKHDGALIIKLSAHSLELVSQFIRVEKGV
jgi:hypothetical protein